MGSANYYWQGHHYSWVEQKNIYSVQSQGTSLSARFHSPKLALLTLLDADTQIVSDMAKFLRSQQKAYFKGKNSKGKIQKIYKGKISAL